MTTFSRISWVFCKFDSKSVETAPLAARLLDKRYRQKIRIVHFVISNFLLLKGTLSIRGLSSMTFTGPTLHNF